MSRLTKLHRFPAVSTAATLLGAVALVPAIAVSPAHAVTTVHSAVVSANPVNWTPGVTSAGSAVRAIAQVGNTMIVGGNFTEVRQQPGAPAIARSNIYAFDATTGAIRPNFAPNVNGEVSTIVPAPDGQSVYIGGAFGQVNGVNYRRVARLSVDTGAAIPQFKPAASNGRVTEMVLTGGRLVIGGTWGKIGGLTRPALATLNPTTGKLDPFIDLGYAGARSNGVLMVERLDVSPDGSKLITIGNFSAVSGQPRHQIAVIDMAGPAAVLNGWSTTRFEPGCNRVFPTYMRDVDISPDGTYFVVVTTGSYRAAPLLCDTASRWELGSSAANQQPTWVNYTGGDTLYRAAITGDVVYIGGHQRWFNNPYAADRVGPGAVGREGIAALDPVNGLPLRWNPGRARGVGVFALLPTEQGLWVGSDTDRIGEWSPLHPKLAFFPLAGGTAVPHSDPGSLPGDVFALGRTSGGDPDAVERRSLDRNGTVGPATAVPNGGNSWRSARGAFMLGRMLYTGWSDGTLKARSFDGSTFGTARNLNLYGATVASELPNMTGMFYDNGRMYFTLSGSNALYYRYFTEESEIVGAERYAVAATTALDWRAVQGMFLDNGQLYWANATNGSLNKVAFAGGQISGSSAVVSSGVDWRSRGLFIRPGSTPNAAPTATFGSACVGLSCSFDASGSADLDGTIAAYAWSFGDGATGATATPNHTYASAGSYPVTLTVTDNGGATGSTTSTVTVTNPPAGGIGFRGSDSSHANARKVHPVTVPASVQAGDGMLLFFTVSTDDAVVTPPSGWTEVDTVSSPNIVTTVWRRVATADDAGTTVRVNTANYRNSGMTLLAYSGTNTTNPVAAVSAAKESTNLANHTTPTIAVADAGSWVVSYWADKTADTTAWSTPGGQVERAEGAGPGTGHISSVATDGNGPLPAGAYGGLTATGGQSTANATMWSIVLK